VIRAIAEAREHGDLSENAEYHAARERQSFIEGRVRSSRHPRLAEVIDTVAAVGRDQVRRHGDHDRRGHRGEKSFQIVGEVEADLERGLLNIKSPLARALIGKDEGDSVEVRTPGGEKSYEIVRIEYS
jgi:transcription elongation factor GreA